MVNESGKVMATGLPTSDPNNAGQLWNDSGTLKVSSGQNLPNQINIVAHLKNKANHPVEEVMEAFAECSKYDYSRCEHFIPIISHYQRKQNWPMAYAIGKYAWENCSTYPYPKSSLFLDKSLYDWRLLDVHTISVSNLNKKYELIKLMSEINRLIENGTIPKSEHNRLINNNKIHQQKLGRVRV